ALGEVDPPPEHLYGLGGVEFVENNALARTGKNDLPHFHRRQPVDVERRHHLVAVVNVYVGDVLDVGVGVRAAPCRDAARGVPDDVVDDRQVVRRQVPDHVDVVLEQAEVDALA